MYMAIFVAMYGYMTHIYSYLISPFSSIYHISTVPPAFHLQFDSYRTLDPSSFLALNLSDAPARKKSAAKNTSGVLKDPIQNIIQPLRIRYPTTICLATDGLNLSLALI